MRKKRVCDMPHEDTRERARVSPPRPTRHRGAAARHQRRSTRTAQRCWRTGRRARPSPNRTTTPRHPRRRQLRSRNRSRTGPVTRRGTHDIAGIGVHIGARIAGIAQPNEVLVSRTVHDLVAGSFDSNSTANTRPKVYQRNGRSSPRQTRLAKSRPEPVTTTTHHRPRTNRSRSPQCRRSSGRAGPVIERGTFCCCP